MIRQLILLPLALSAAVLSPEANAVLYGTEPFGTQPASLIRSAGTVSGMILKDSSFDESAFLNLGGKIMTRSPEVFTAEVPFDSLERLSSVRGVLQFTPAHKVSPLMFYALPAGNAVKVYTGELNRKYSGSGVITGIIDCGFDFRHPSFQSADGSCRITRVWDQLSKSGTPPAGYYYGEEISSPEAVFAKDRCSNTKTSHGTHVASIAAGSWNKYSRGTAPGAELVLVSTNMYDNGIVDGLRWIFDYAESQNKPAVVNISLGSHYGPHDGSSSIDRIFEAFAGSGKIIVGASGNERSDRCRCSFVFGRKPTAQTAADLSSYNIVRTSVSLSDVNQDYTGMEQISLWGEKDQNFSVGVELWENGMLLDKTPLFTTKELEQKKVYSTSIPHNSGRLSISMYGELRSPLNGKSNAVVQIKNSTPLSPSSSLEAVLVFSAFQGEVNAWTALGNNDSIPGFFAGEPGFLAGDSVSTMSEIGGTSRGIISVGAFTSAVSFKGITGANVPAHGKKAGESAPFSSMGPTIDGRVKPDITAPGDVIVAALRRGLPDGNRFLSSYMYSGSEDFPYGGFSGTSMASPFTTGTAALMLEADPSLTPEEIKTIFAETAFTDLFTGLIPKEGSSVWGVGKINVDGAVTAAETRKRSGARAAQPQVKFTSGSKGIPEIQFSGIAGQSVQITVLDLRGRVLSQRSELVHSSPIPAAKNLAAGTYICRTAGTGFSSSTKFSVH